MMMNQCAIIQQKNGFAFCREDVARDYVVCPKPRRSNAKTDLLDIILSKSGCGLDSEKTYTQKEWQPSFFSGSPPSRVSNPLIQDARFIEVRLEHPTLPNLMTPSPSARKSGFVRSNFGNKPAVRVEGFKSVDIDGRNCNLTALA